MNLRAFLAAASVGLLGNLFAVALSGGVSLLLMPAYFSDLSTVATDPRIIQFTSIISTIGCLLSLITPIFYTGVGLLFVRIARQPGVDLSPEAGAAGGALSAGMARFTGGLASSAASIVFYPYLLNLISRSVREPFPPEAQTILPFMLLLSAAGGLFSTCMGTLFAAVLGALGGAVGAAVLESRQQV